MNSTCVGLFITGLQTEIAVTLLDGSSQFRFTGSLDLYQPAGNFLLERMSAGLTSIELQGSSANVVSLLCPVQTPLEAITFNLACQDEDVTVEFFVGNSNNYSAPALSGVGFTTTLPLS